jgi:hypothetical protein
MDGAEEQEGFHRKLWVVLIEAHKFNTLERTRAFPVIFIKHYYRTTKEYMHNNKNKNIGCYLTT